MSSDAIKRVQSARGVEEALKRTIMNGEFPRGAKLPPERLLTERFQVSRTALREAIKALQAQHLISVRHGYGTFVEEDFSKAFVGTLETLLTIGDISLVETMEAREFLEPMLAAQAASVRTDAEATELRDLVERMDECRDEPGRYEELDAILHRQIASLSGNRLIVNMLDSIRLILRSQLGQLLTEPAALERTARQREHLAIVQAVSDGLPDEARKMMVEHLEHAKAAMLSQRGNAVIAGRR